MNGQAQKIDDDLRRRVLEQLCKGRSFAFAAGVTGLTSSTVASIAEAAGWPDESKARQTWLHLQRTLEANQERPPAGLPVPRPRSPQPATAAPSESDEAPALDAIPDPEPEPAVEATPAPSDEPMPPVFVDPES